MGLATTWPGGSHGRPRSAGSSPRARCAAAGASRSRPWNVREITLGLTIVRHGAETAAKSGGSAKLVTAATGSEAAGAEKRSDVTLLYKLNGTAAPFVTTVFKEPLGIPLSLDQEWHWAIVRAKGTPPPAPAPVPGQ